MNESPWDLAHRAAAAAGVELRPLTTLDDCDRILDVMIATWGNHQLLPREMIRALAESGNVPWGAFVGDEMVGYVLDWVGVDPEDGPHVHSHMLAAMPDRRHRGTGSALKLAQRARALEQGIHLARWTFDPLVARNAYLNLVKLGAVADRFFRNFYGDMGDTLNRGDRSDRLLVRWDLDRDPSEPRPSDASRLPMVLVHGAAEEPVTNGRPSSRGALVEVPADHTAMKERDPETAERWRDAVADAFDAGFSAGLIVAGFDRGRSAYVLLPEGVK